MTHIWNIFKNLLELCKEKTLNIDEKFASHHKMGHHNLSHKHEKCLTSFVIGEMQNRMTAYMIFLEKWKWRKKIPNEF